MTGKLIRFTFISIVLFFTSSCATLLTSNSKKIDINSDPQNINVTLNEEEFVNVDKIKINQKEYSILDFDKEGYFKSQTLIYPDKIKPITYLSIIGIFPLFVDMASGKWAKVSTKEINVKLDKRTLLKEELSFNLGKLTIEDINSNGIGKVKTISKYFGNNSFSSTGHVYATSKKTVLEKKGLIAFKEELEYAGVNTNNNNSLIKINVSIKDLYGQFEFFNSSVKTRACRKALTAKVEFEIIFNNQKKKAKTYTVSETKFLRIDNIYDYRGLNFNDHFSVLMKKAAAAFLRDETNIEFFDKYTKNINGTFTYGNRQNLSFLDYKNCFSTVVINKKPSHALIINSLGHVLLASEENIETAKIKLPNGLMVSLILNSDENSIFYLGQINTSSQQFAAFASNNYKHGEPVVIIGFRDDEYFFKEDNKFTLSEENNRILVTSSSRKLENGDVVCNQNAEVLGIITITDEKTFFNCITNIN